MTTNTNDLIRRLAANVAPVRALPQPRARAAAWLAVSVPYVAVVAIALSVRNDLSSRLTDPRFIAEAVTPLAIGIVATVAAFASVVPGYGRRWSMLTLVLLAVWLGNLGIGCVKDWIQFGSGGLLLKTDWSCFPAILLAGGAPMIVMAMMLRRGAPLTPVVTMALGGLASGGLADVAMRVHHREAGVMVVAWHLAAVIVLTAVPSAAARRVLQWRDESESLSGIAAG